MPESSPKSAFVHHYLRFPQFLSDRKPIPMPEEKSWLYKDKLLDKITMTTIILSNTPTLSAPIQTVA